MFLFLITKAMVIGNIGNEIENLRNTFNVLLNQIITFYELI